MRNETCQKLIELGLKNLVKNQMDQMLSSVTSVKSDKDNIDLNVQNLITLDELSKRLGMSKTTLWRYRKKGMPSMKPAKKIIYDYSEVVKWMGGFRNA